MPAENLEGKLITARRKKRLRRRLIQFSAVAFGLHGVCFLGLRLQLHSINEEIAVLEKKKFRWNRSTSPCWPKNDEQSRLCGKRAREALGLIKPGEKILLPPKPGGSAPGAGG